LEAKKSKRETEQSRSKKRHKKHKPQREEGKPNQRGEKNKGQGNKRGPGFGKGVETLRSEQSCVQGGYIFSKNISSKSQNIWNKNIESSRIFNSLK
jgi:hypothetical protein